jgi:hypothetical protein
MIALYQKLVSRASSEEIVGTARMRGAEIKSFEFVDKRGVVGGAFATGAPLVVRIDWASTQHVADVTFHVSFYTQDNVLVSQLNTEDGERVDLRPGTGRIRFTCPELGLMPGIYYADIFMRERAALRGQSFHYLQYCAVLHVNAGKPARGSFHMPHTWQIDFDDVPPSGADTRSS